MSVGSSLLRQGRIHGKPYAGRGGYLYAWDPSAKRVRRVSRIVMEQHLGRALLPTEHVHHENHIRTDDRAENLILTEKGDHLEIHGQRGELRAVSCPVCGTTREVRDQVARKMQHGACKNCKNSLSNATRFGHILKFWFLRDTGEIIGPFTSRRDAYDHAPSVRRKGKSIVTLNTRTTEITCCVALPPAIAEAIRARATPPKQL